MTDLFDFKPKPKQFAVFGNPIAHSKSPQIHQAFALQLGLDLVYEKTLVEPGGFVSAVEHFFASGGSGLNITVPFKLEAWQLADERTDRCELAGAANTLWQVDGRIVADNTDGIGLFTDISTHWQFDMANKRVLILGAGGAVRGVLGPIVQHGPASLTIANRTLSNAEALALLFQAGGEALTHGTPVDAQSYTSLPGEPYDLIINGTSASLSGQLPPLAPGLVHDQTLVVDMMYQAEPTVFMKWALDHGAAQAADGLGMLVEQAAAAFTIWHGVSPETKPVIEALRQGV